MKNVLFGLAVGVVVGYVLRRMEDQGQFECCLLYTSGGKQVLL